ncbi:ATP-binding protein [Nitrosophilus labii]|uniref:ATP-binding protein n=1 Tax=Nitrosophilus labii TaxID=2706014 RepID=UPI001656EF62|nr:ATP-binding protein [Nitrosophilus labii]
MLKKTQSFASAFYHDIKNKLGTIRFSLSLLINNVIEDRLEKEKLLKNALLSVEKTIDMLQDFIELQRFKQNRRLKQESIDIVKLFYEIKYELEPDLQVQKVKLFIFSDSNETKIIANRLWLKKALFNIVHNAVKYNKKDGKVAISIVKYKSWWLLKIEDTGKGLTQEEAVKIFDKYFSTSEKNSGTGLGLTMSKRVIESFGGRLELQSKPDVGTTFYIYLPNISKQIKIKRLSAILAAASVAVLFGLDYYYCLVPQKIDVKASGEQIVLHLENDLVARFYKNDRYEIFAYKNLFNTKTRTEISLDKANLYLTTASNPVTVYTKKSVWQNLGTEFETIVDEKETSVSVYKGAVASKDLKVKQNEGVIYTQKGFKKSPLPKAVEGLRINRNKEGVITLSWISPYKSFRVIASRDKFFTLPGRVISSSKKEVRFNSLDDGIWYFLVQAEEKKLFSMPKRTKILSLTNYLKAKKAFEENDLLLATVFIKKSISTINEVDSRPYTLYGEIFYKQKMYLKALKFFQKAIEIGDKDEDHFWKVKTLYRLKKYKEAIKSANHLLLSTKYKNSSKLYLVLAKSYFELKDLKNSEKYLWRVLEICPKDKVALDLMLRLQKQKGDKFLIKTFEELLRNGYDY